MRKFLWNLWPGRGERTAPIPAKCAPNVCAAGDCAATSGASVIDGVEDGSLGADGTKSNTLFGVKSYLNYFYLSPTADFDGTANFAASLPTSSASGGVWYLLPPASSRRRAARAFYLLFHALTVVGLLLLLGGAFAIVVGYSWPTIGAAWNRFQQRDAELTEAAEDIGGATHVEASVMRIIVDQDDNGNFYIHPERFAELLRDPMHEWKITGFCMFAFGASLLTFSLLFTSILGVRGTRWAAILSDAPPGESPVRIYPGGGVTANSTIDPSKFHIEPARRAAGSRISPTSGPVPTGFEELARVQPTNLRKSPSTPTPNAKEALLLDGISAKGGDDTCPLLANQ